MSYCPVSTPMSPGAAQRPDHRVYPGFLTPCARASSGFRSPDYHASGADRERRRHWRHYRLLTGAVLLRVSPGFEPPTSEPLVPPRSSQSAPASVSRSRILEPSPVRNLAICPCEGLPRPTRSRKAPACRPHPRLRTPSQGPETLRGRTARVLPSRRAPRKGSACRLHPRPRESLARSGNLAREDARSLRGFSAAPAALLAAALLAARTHAQPLARSETLVREDACLAGFCRVPTRSLARVLLAARTHAHRNPSQGPETLRGRTLCPCEGFCRVPPRSLARVLLAARTHAHRNPSQGPETLRGRDLCPCEGAASRPCAA